MKIEQSKKHNKAKIKIKRGFFFKKKKNTDEIERNIISVKRIAKLKPPLILFSQNRNKLQTLIPQKKKKKISFPCKKKKIKNISLRVSDQLKNVE